jgi:hypothetical protein
VEWYAPDFIKVAIVKDKKILILVIEPLNCVCLTLGEVPDVTKLEHVNLIFPILVHRGNQDAALVHKTPFSLKF